MKKFSRILFAAAAAALAFSCAKSEPVEAPAEGLYEYEVVIDSPTKTVFDGNVVKWETNDRIGYYSSTDTKNRYSNVTLSAGVASFKCSLYSALSATNVLYAYYPYAYNSNATTDGPTKVAMAIPASQTNGDADAMPQVSIPFVCEGALANEAVVAIKFCNLGSIARFLVFSSNAALRTETVKSVRFDADKALAGAFNFDITAVDYSAPATFAISGLSETSVMLKWTGSVAADKDAATALDMVVAPGSYSGSIVVTTDEATYTFALSAAKEFARSAAKPLGLDLAKAVRVELPVQSFQKITSVSEIVAGEYIITANGSTFDNDAASAGKVAAVTLAAAGLTPVADVISTKSMDWSWTFAGTSSAMSVKSVTNPSLFLYANNDNNGLVIGSTSDTWSFAASKKTAGTFNMKEANNSRYLAYYSGTPNFRSYANLDNGVPDIALYKKLSLDPEIFASDISNVPATGAASAEASYSVANFSDDVEVASYTGCVKEAIVVAGKIVYDVDPNYTLSAKEGTIVLRSASRNEITKTVTVSQKKSVFEVVADNPIELLKGAGSEKTFTIKSSFGGTVVNSNETDFICDDTFAADEAGVKITVMTMGAGSPTEFKTATLTVKRQGQPDYVVNVRQEKNVAETLETPTLLSVSNPSTSGFEASWVGASQASSYDWILSKETTAEAALLDAAKITGNVTAATVAYAGTIATGTYYLYVRSKGDEVNYISSAYAKSSAVVVSAVISFSWSRSGTSDTTSDGVKFTHNLKSGSGYYQDNSTVQTYYAQLLSTSALFTGIPNSVTVKARLGGGTTKSSMGEGKMYVCLLDNSGAPIAGTETELTNEITAAGGSDFSVTIPVTTSTAIYGAKLYHSKISSYNVRYYSLELRIAQ